jgi:hypothetical protein
MRCWLAAVSPFLLFTSLLSAAERPVSFNRDIKPILAGKCFACHGPDAAERKADLRLDLSEPAHASGVLTADPKGIVAIVARVTSSDPEERMPPATSKKPGLTDDEVKLLKRWVAESAKYDAHWAFVPPVKHPLPEVKDPEWATSAIDRFVAAAHAEQGLKGSPEADRRTLIRRLSMDLIGLPPTVAEVEAFEKDTAPDAYEKVVDRLLASQHFGERLAVYWLDVVRYADSAGYHSDNERNVTPYRDYVIRSFNGNLPIDQFLREQIAGDLLPNPTVWQKVASGYNRLLQTTEEGGAQAKEYMAKYAADRARNFGSAFLALTTGCCECHNHKFDPLTTKDFYSLEAFFADIQEAAVGRREPGIPVPSDEQAAELDRLTAAVGEAQKALDAAAQQAIAKADVAALKLTEWKPGKIAAAKVQGTSTLKALDDGSLRSEGAVAAKENYEIELAEVPASITGIRLEALANDALPAKGPGTAPNGNFVLTHVKLALVSADGKELELKLEKAIADHNQQSFEIAGALNPDPNNGWAILPEAGKSHEAVFQLAKATNIAQGEKLRVTLAFQSPHAQHNIGQLRLTVTADPSPVDHFTAGDLKSLLAVPAQKRSPEQSQKLLAYYRDRSPATEAERAKLAAATAARQQLENSMPKCIISVSGAPRPIRILPRGNWLDDSGEIVEPATPEFLGKLNVSGRRATRLDLADWLVAKNHPLTARVFVNRVWKLLFGRGITKAAEDFGTQGEFPSHPELLDQLSVDFVENGWNLKRLVKQIVMSRTYRQSSLASHEMREKDPANVFLARQSRFRYEAELVRDNALAVSGLLVPKVGGPSVFPYQPAGYWAYLNFPVREWQNSQGEGLYRRGLYTHWQRSFLHPSLLAFDATSREECVVDRPRSNTPLQALVLLNDPTYVEAARSLAARTIGSASDRSARLEYLYRQALQRSPRPPETQSLFALYEKHLAEYRADEKAAADLMTVGAYQPPTGVDKAELAAWTSVARVVLNLHESITRN